jgi:hypothetical protein
VYQQGIATTSDCETACRGDRRGRAELVGQFRGFELRQRVQPDRRTARFSPQGRDALGGTRLSVSARRRQEQQPNAFVFEAKQEMPQ